MKRVETDWNRWGTQGKEFLNGAIQYMEDGNYLLAMFSLHQAVESSLMALIKIEFGCRMTAHNLARMVRITQLFTDEIKNKLQLHTPEGVRLFALLQSAYSDARYKTEFVADEKDVAALLEIIIKILKKVESMRR